jgi:hypothetical protein
MISSTTDTVFADMFVALSRRHECSGGRGDLRREDEEEQIFSRQVREARSSRRQECSDGRGDLRREDGEEQTFSRQVQREARSSRRQECSDGGGGLKRKDDEEEMEEDE